MSSSQIFRISNGKVVLPDRVVEDGIVDMERGRIAYAGETRRRPRAAKEIDARGGWICPGLIDIHIHGAGRQGFDPPSPDSFRTIADTLMRNGVTTFLPTMMASKTMIGGIAGLIEETGLRSRAPGLHVEGPFVNEAKRGGIQPKYIESTKPKRLRDLQNLARGMIRLMVFAPELPDADRVWEAMQKLGIQPAVGHTMANADQCACVIGRRKVNVTHLFNAMTGLDHKEPGVAAWALNAPNAYVELNSDGEHVAPDLVRITRRAKPPDRIVLMSDAVISAGEPPGDYPYMNKTIRANDRGAFYSDSGTLVGSRCLLNESLGKFIEFTGAPVHEAVGMATANPARLLGLSRRGRLLEGLDADIAIFGRNFRHVQRVWIRGTEQAF